MKYPKLEPGNKCTDRYGNPTTISQLRKALNVKK